MGITDPQVIRFMVNGATRSKAVKDQRIQALSESGVFPCLS
jgi:hypothetical protein